MELVPIRDDVRSHQSTSDRYDHAPGVVITEACADSQVAPTGVVPRCFFYFARFPKEIQLAVVEAALISDEPIVDLSPRGINLAFLQTCKQVHDEGTKTLFSKNTFHFTDLSILLGRIKPGRFGQSKPVDYFLEHIEHLSFDVSLAKAKFEPSPTEPLNSTQVQAILEAHNASVLAIYEAEDIGGILKIITIQHKWDAKFAQIMRYVSKKGLTDCAIRTVTMKATGAFEYLEALEVNNEIPECPSEFDAGFVLLSKAIFKHTVPLKHLCKIFVQKLEGKAVLDQVAVSVDQGSLL